MPSLSDLKNKSKVIINFTDTDLDIEVDFTCELPHQRLMQEALHSASKSKGGKQSIDSLVFSRKIFVPCVMGWTIEQECSTETKMEFLGEDAVLNKMANHVALKLMRLAQAKVDEEEGN